MIVRPSFISLRLFSFQNIQFLKHSIRIKFFRKTKCVYFSLTNERLIIIADVRALNVQKSCQSSNRVSKCIHLALKSDRIFFANDSRRERAKINRSNREQREAKDRCRFTYVTRGASTAHIHSPIKTYARLVTRGVHRNTVKSSHVDNVCDAPSRAEPSRAKVSAHVALSRLPFKRNFHTGRYTTAHAEKRPIVPITRDDTITRTKTVVEPLTQGRVEGKRRFD